MSDKPLFLKWALINVLYAIFLVVAAITYNGHIHRVAWVFIGIVLIVYTAASTFTGREAWWSTRSRHMDLRPLREAITVTPMIALLGTSAGFLIALSSNTADIQQRVVGAATGLSATFIGIASTLVLMLQHYLFSDEA